MLLLTGGDKATQSRDILRAQEYLVRLHGGKAAWPDEVETGISA